MNRCSKNISFHYYSFVPVFSALLDLLYTDPDIYLTYYAYTSFIDESLSVKANRIIVPNSIVVPDEEDYHMMLAASKDLFKIAQEFKEKVDKLRIMNPEEHKKRLENIKKDYEVFD